MPKRTLSTSSSFINKIYTSPFKKNSKRDSSDDKVRQNDSNMNSPILPLSINFDVESNYTKSINQQAPSIGSNTKKFQFQSPLETKKYNESKCCFCNDLLSLILPGETILPLKCGHISHKNCFTLMLNKKELDKLPMCGICKTPTKCNDESIYNSIIENFHLQQEIKVDIVKDVIKQPVPQIPQPRTPIDQQKYVTHLETPPRNEQVELSIYQPVVEFCELSKNVPEIDFKVTIKPPPIHQQDSNFNLYDLQLKFKISNFIKKNLHLQKDLGELICFDTLQISIDGTNFENSIVYLFENYLIFYDLNDVPLGMICKSDFCNLNLTNEILCLNLCKSSLPELYLKHEFNTTIILKWEHLISCLHEMKTLHTNLYQFTSTLWIKYKEFFQISKDLIKFNQMIVQNEHLPNNYLIKILPPPKDLRLNLIISVSLINKTGLNDSEYRIYLQEMIEKILSSLNTHDTLSIIFIGIDNNRRAKDSGIYIGPISSDWPGWKELIEDLVILPNSLVDLNHELNLSIEKCIDLLPFLPNEKCINKFFIITSSHYENKCMEFDSQKFEILNNELSISVIKIGENVTGFPKLQESKVILKSTFNHFLSTAEQYIQEISKICIPKLTIDLVLNKGVQIKLIDSNDAILSSSKKKLSINVKDLKVDGLKTFTVKFKVDYNQFDSTLPLLEYSCSWFNQTKFNKPMKVMAKPHFTLPRVPMTPNEDEIDIDISIN